MCVYNGKVYIQGCIIVLSLDWDGSELKDGKRKDGIGKNRSRRMYGRIGEL